MLTILMIVIYGVVALILLPLAVSSLIAGSPAPENTILTKFYRAEPRLMLAGNLFLIVLGVIAIARIADHFGALGEGLSERLDFWLGIPFGILLLLFLVLFARAAMKVRRAGATG